MFKVTECPKLQNVQMSKITKFSEVTKILRYKMLYTTFINQYNIFRQCKTLQSILDICTFCNFGHFVTLDIL